MPSKALLHAAAVHHGGGDYPWSKAVGLPRLHDQPRGDRHARRLGPREVLEGAGATVIRGTAALDGPGRVRVETTACSRPERSSGRGIGQPRAGDLPGLAEAHPWTNVQGTSTRGASALAGRPGRRPDGVELSQVYARYGVPVTLIHPRDRVNDKDHPRSTALLAESLDADGVTLRLESRATRVRAGEGTDGAHVVEVDDGAAEVEGHEILLAIGRDFPLDGLGLDTVGVTPTDGRLEPDDRLRVAEDVYVAGDVGGPEMHTHLGHYNGEAARGSPSATTIGPSSTPSRARPTPIRRPRPSGLLWSRPRARDRRQGVHGRHRHLVEGLHRRGQGHVTIVVDRTARRLVGAFMAGPAVSEAVHECVLAIRADIPLATLADTIHAFPTVARVLGTAFIDADRELPA